VLENHPLEDEQDRV